MRKITISVFIFLCVCFLSCSNSLERKACNTIEDFLQAVQNNDIETVKKIAPFMNNYSNEEQKSLIQFFYTLSEQKIDISPNSISDGIIYVDLELYDSKAENIYTYVLECVQDENENIILTENFTQKTTIQYIDNIDFEE